MGKIEIDLNRIKITNKCPKGRRPKIQYRPPFDNDGVALIGYSENKHNITIPAKGTEVLVVHKGDVLIGIRCDESGAPLCGFIWTWE